MFIPQPSKALLALLACFALVTACSTSEDPSEAVNTNESSMDSLVTAEWLHAHLDDPDLVVLDCSVTVEIDDNGGFRTVNGRPAYDEGHIPTANFADLMGELADGM